MATDRFVGGPLDGQEWNAAELAGLNVFMDPRTQVQYERRNGNRWVLTPARGPSPIAPSNKMFKIAPQGRNPITLEQLEGLIWAARAANVPGDWEVHGLTRWSGRLSELELKPPKT
ncbi:hypothetical protein ACMX2H_15930 [Arthrobacter sulfonylureivorans]|uniref:hypothetical protein n=1 Tax=Arthrobacter sulfonylureivorans TaxID=2486855 RepID=UPI0039E4D38A